MSNQQIPRCGPVNEHCELSKIFPQMYLWETSYKALCEYSHEGSPSTGFGWDTVDWRCHMVFLIYNQIALITCWYFTLNRLQRIKAFPVSHTALTVNKSGMGTKLGEDTYGTLTQTNQEDIPYYVTHSVTTNLIVWCIDTWNHFRWILESLFCYLINCRLEKTNYIFY